MIERNFAITVENTLNQLLNQIEAGVPEVEGDLVDSVLTLLLPDGSQIILNRQEAVQQIWLACSDGPARFAQENGTWRDTRSGESLEMAVGRLLGRRLHHPVQIG